MRLKVREWALKKMATQFQTFKKRLHNGYIKKKRTPTFTGPLEKIKKSLGRICGVQGIV
jgi:hypothetical protein